MLVFIIESVFCLVHFVGIFLPLLLVVAFVTLLERKEIAIMQKRRGPNVVGVFGLLQPFSDGLKLFLKEPVLPYVANKIVFLLSPILTFFCTVFSWSFVPFGGVGSYANLELGLLFVLAFSSLSVYGIIFAGWSSNSKYAFLGSLRSASQLISYEVSFTLALLPIIVVSQSVDFETIVLVQKNCWFLVPFFISASLVFISILAETNRLPFDLPEAEAELVSGYNVEYSSMTFAFFYLAEYLSILLMSMLFTIFFLGGWFFCGYTSFFFLSIKVFCVVYFVIWVRVTFPRYRFDQLLQIGWKYFLPLTMGFFLFFVMCFWFVYLTFFWCL